MQKMHCPSIKWKSLNRTTVSLQSWWKSMSILKGALITYNRSLTTFWQSWWSRLFSLSHVLFRGSADFPNYPKNSVSHFFWPHSALSCNYVQINISNQIGNHDHLYLPYGYWNYCSLPGSLLSYKEMSIIIEVSEHAILKAPCRVSETKSYPVATWALKEDYAFLLMGGDMLFSVCGIRVRTVQRRRVTSGYCSKYPDKRHRLTPDHRWVGVRWGWG